MIALFVYQTHKEDSGQEEHLHRADKLVSVTNGYHASSENKTINKWDVNESEMKRAVKKTDVKVRKVCRVVSHGLMRHYQWAKKFSSNWRRSRLQASAVKMSKMSKKFSTAAVEYKVKNVSTQMANKNSRKRKHDEVEKASAVLLDRHSTMPVKKKTVNSCTCTEKCTDVSKTRKVGRKVRSVQCNRTMTGNEGLSRSSSFGMTKKPSRKLTDSCPGVNAPSKETGSVTICSEVKINVTDDRKKFFKKHKKTSSCADSNVPMSPEWRRNRLQASAMIYKQGEGEVNSREVKHVAQTPQETTVKHEIPLPCTSIGGRTLRSDVRRNGSSVSKQASRDDGSEVKTDTSETVKETNYENKHTLRCSDTGAQTPQETFVQHEIPLPCTNVGGRTLRSDVRRNGSTVNKEASRNDGSKVKTDTSETVKETNYDNKHTLRCSDTGITSRRCRTASQLATDDAVCNNASTVDIGKEVVRVHQGQSPCSNFDAMQTLQKADCLSTVDSLYEEDNNVIDVNEANNNIDKTLQKKFEKHKGAAVGQQVKTADHFTVKSSVTESIPVNKTVKECDYGSLCMNCNVKLQRCETENVYTEAAAVCQKVSTVKDTSYTKFSPSNEDKGLLYSFHMTLRPRRQRSQYSVMSGRKSQTVSHPASSKRSVKSLQPCEIENVYTEAAAVCQKESNLVDTNYTKFNPSRHTDRMKKSNEDKGLLSCFHMTLRPRRQHRQYSVMAGRKSQTVSDSASNKRCSVKSEDKSGKPCWNGSQKLRCSRSWCHC